MQALRKSYDVVIVGAGVGGGAMANRLAEAGATVLVIERGTRLPREADNWSVKAVFHERKYSTRETWRDRDGKEFTPSTYYYVGGNSKFFGTATIRFREQDFLGMQHEAGSTPAWPITYADLAPIMTSPNSSWAPTALPEWTRANLHGPAPCPMPPLAMNRSSPR